MGDADDVGEAAEPVPGDLRLELVDHAAGRDGSLNVAVPTCTAEAPAATSSSASRPVRTPPTPMSGAVGRRPSRIAAVTCHSARTATGRIAGPESPPVTPASWGRSRSVSTTMPSRVLIIVSPSAPAASAAAAIVTMSVTSGVSFAKIGVPRGSRSRTSRTTRSEETGSHAKTSPRLATLGHEMFTSTPTTAPYAGLLASRSATSANSSAVVPAIETRALAPTDPSQARSLSTNASMPGPWRPIELSIPEAVSAMRGVPRPARGAAMTVLVTKAPSSETGKNRCSS